jgi:ADP-heptose:LPS heptosyltransferase
MKKTLVVRHTRIGDAILALPLVGALAEKYPMDHFTVLTNNRFVVLSDLMPSNIELIGMPAKQAKGMFRNIVFGLKRSVLLFHLKKKVTEFEQVAFFQYDSFEKELHRHIRRNFPHIQVVVADDKRFWQTERLKNKCSDNVSMIGIYQDALAKLRYEDVHVRTDYSHDFSMDLLSNETVESLNLDFSKKLVAFSPFSKESSKIYPLDRMEIVIDHFAKLQDTYQVLILGGGEHEEAHAERWVAKHPHVISLIGKVKFLEEIVIVSKCKVVLAMDSFNMHLAFFLKVPVVSIWGPTAPQNGYYPPYYGRENVIMRNLDCQPCSMYGEYECTHDVKLECLNIPPSVLIHKIEQLLF